MSWLISKHFKESEINPNNYDLTQEQKDNLQKLISKMDVVRDLLGKPIKPTSCVRSAADQARINPKAPKSAHLEGLAIDFQVIGMTVDQVLDVLQPLCSSMGFSLENNGSLERMKKNGADMNEVKEPRNWVHLQVRPLTKLPPWRLFNP